MDDDKLMSTSSSEETVNEDIQTEDTSFDEPKDESQTEDVNRRSAESRIDQLIARNKQKEEELEQLKEKMQYMEQAISHVQPPTRQDSEFVPNPEAQKAAAILRQMGVVFEDNLDEREKLMRDRLSLNDNHSRYESTFDGSDGRPKYDRQRIEKFMVDKQVFDPEAAYKLMYENELTDWAIKKAGESMKQKPNVIRSTTGGSQDTSNTITIEKIREVMNNPTDPKKRAWYERNYDKIKDLMAKGLL